eukprot:TRINITY_DN8276_c0_g1_i1.p1 TRINITY_DN8276_c0_g1~~TRINITY_DN8276_c0_g1_i1.p1  ORF type:complete len:198 (+),score=37.48 TRINITY_DN8276_c0_g1_i1:34-594(+)
MDQQQDLGGEPIELQNKWVLWHDPQRGSTTADYEANLTKIAEFDTVQSFWECFNNLPHPNHLKIKNVLHVMLDGIKPLWEDPRNETGGVWTIKVKKADTMTVWTEVLLASIGEQFAPVLEEGDEINGISLSTRPGEDNIIQVWNHLAGEVSSGKIWKKIKSLVEVMDVEICSSFYRHCKAHSDFKK